MDDEYESDGQVTLRSEGEKSVAYESMRLSCKELFRILIGRQLVLLRPDT